MSPVPDPTHPTGPDLPAAGEHAAFASARLFTDEDATVGVATFEPDDAGRELGDGRVLSGWSLFVGDETAEELADAERVRLPSLRVVLEMFPAVADVLDANTGDEASWVFTDGHWQQVPG